MNALVIVLAVALVQCASAERGISGYTAKWKQPTQTGYETAYYPYYGQYGAGTYGYDTNYKYSQDGYGTYPIDSQRLHLSGGIYRPYDYDNTYAYKSGYKPYTYDNSYQYYGTSGIHYLRRPYGTTYY